MFQQCVCPLERKVFIWEQSKFFLKENRRQEFCRHCYISEFKKELF